jgi:hypothetical protein
MCSTRSASTRRRRPVGSECLTGGCGDPSGALGRMLRFRAGLVGPGRADPAQDRPTRLNVWDIHIGEAASEIPDGFINYACGTDGGPPSVPLKNSTEFKKCRSDANDCTRSISSMTTSSSTGRALSTSSRDQDVRRHDGVRIPGRGLGVVRRRGAGQGRAPGHPPAAAIVARPQRVLDHGGFHPPSFLRRWLGMPGLTARRGGEPGRLLFHQESLREGVGWPAPRPRTTLFPEKGPAVPRSLHRQTPDGKITRAGPASRCTMLRCPGRERGGLRAIVAEGSMRCLGIWLVLVLLQSGGAAEAEDCPTPADLHDGWTVSAPAAQGLDPALVCAIGPRFEAWTEASLHSVVVARHGALVYEHYLAGEDEQWGPAARPGRLRRQQIA